MTAWAALARFLTTDPMDPGCAETLEGAPRWVELLTAGIDPAALMPGVAAHLGACDPCGEDVRGLLAAVAAGPGLLR